MNCPQSRETLGLVEPIGLGDEHAATTKTAATTKRNTAEPDREPKSIKLIWKSG